MVYKSANNTSNHLESSPKSSILFWILTTFTTLFLFWAPFQKALFNGNTFDFERPLYSSFLWGAIILFLVSIFLFYNWRFKHASDLLSLIIWLIPLTFIISLVSAASSYYAVNIIYIQLVYVIFFLLGIYLSRSDLGVAITRGGLIASGYFIVIFGLANWFGNKEVIFSLVKMFIADGTSQSFYRDAIMTDSNGVRLTSVFQYANSYAAFLIALMLCSIYLVITSKKWIMTLIHSFMSIIIIVSFFLTLSRGGLVILPVVLLFILPFLKPQRQLLFIIHIILSFGVSLLVLSKVTTIGIEINKQFTSSLSFQGWAIIIVASLINAGIAFVIQKFLAGYIQNKLIKFQEKRFINLIIPVTALIIGTISIILLFQDTGITKLLPENIKTRVENINFQQHSVLERGTFYADAIKLYKDYPVIGAGGGAWSALYEKYQNNPYVSRQAHNFFLQYLVEVGAIGFAILLLVLGAIFYIFIRSFITNKSQTDEFRFVFYIIAISLLIHSMIDFDLSYVYLGIVLFLSLGSMISKINIGLLGSKWGIIEKYRWIYPSLLLVISLFMFFNASQLLNANSNFQNAVNQAQNNKSINEVFPLLDVALKKHSNHPEYVSYKTDILLQVYNQTKDEKYYNEAVSLIQQTRKKEHFNRSLIEKEAQTLMIKEQFPQALELVDQEIINFPWDITLYEKAISLNFDLGNKARMEKNNALKDQYWNQSIAIYNKIQEKTKILEALPKEQSQGRAFGLTKNMALTLGQIYYINANYSAAEGFLKFNLTEQFDDQANLQMARWYLASLQKQNKADQPLLDKLIAKDPKEREEINKLVNATF
ncbi:O-antigen ligase family protein [Paenibacillus agricola]|uniref:O-antigen ligase domain-containing protein n=1 Tax=Paenibacillus agricola TaxID=2716264 RepID=A0ABX0JFX6_9BACL|nr:O-antigen ligase family protein [Paenibacillus agricola]NHN34270.1 O-antigen ligase domain-containing protein [Paenibacillus agricola]